VFDFVPGERHGGDESGSSLGWQGKAEKRAALGGAAGSLNRRDLRVVEWGALLATSLGRQAARRFFDPILFPDELNESRLGHFVFPMG